MTPVPELAVQELGRRARAASRILATAGTSSKDAALLTAADLLLERASEIQAANDADLDAARAAGMEQGPLDRLKLTDARLEGMANGVRTVAALPDPVGEVLDGWKRPNGLVACPPPVVARDRRSPFRSSYLSSTPNHRCPPP